MPQKRTYNVMLINVKEWKENNNCKGKCKIESVIEKILEDNKNVK